MLTFLRFALLAAMVFSTQDAWARESPSTDHPVLAYYYNWWSPGTFSDTLEQPLVDYGAPEHLREHVRQARNAGIDGFIVNRSQDIRAVLNASDGSDFTVTLQVDSATASQEVQAFSTLLNEPRLVRYEGRPVLFFWATWTRPSEFWSDLRARVDPDHNAVWLADGDRFEILQSDAWDGISPYAIAWSNNPTANILGWAGKARANAPEKLFVPPVSPGCDDSRARPTTCAQDRAGGAYYQRSLAAALALQPRWAVVVSTWNEWMENTQVEPSTQEGDIYVTLTRAVADTLHGAA